MIYRLIIIKSTYTCKVNNKTVKNQKKIRDKRLTFTKRQDNNNTVNKKKAIQEVYIKLYNYNEASDNILDCNIFFKLTIDNQMTTNFFEKSYK